MASNLRRTPSHDNTYPLRSNLYVVGMSGTPKYLSRFHRLDSNAGRPTDCRITLCAAAYCRYTQERKEQAVEQHDHQQPQAHKS